MMERAQFVMTHGMTPEEFIQTLQTAGTGGAGGGGGRSERSSPEVPHNKDSESMGSPLADRKPATRGRAYRALSPDIGLT